MSRLMFLASSLLFAMIASVAGQEVVTVGRGGYLQGLPVGAKGPPSTIYATPEMRSRMPTNDWWSSLAWLPFSERQYAHPLAMEAEPRGFRVYYPGHNITANQAAIFGFMLPKNDDDFVIGSSEGVEFKAANVAGYSDFFVTAQFGDEKQGFNVTYGHGSPFVFMNYTSGSPRISSHEPPRVWSGDANSPVLGITVNKKHYGLFAPAGTIWTGLETKQLQATTDKPYFSLAILPDNKPETLALFRKYAYNHVRDSYVDWKFDEPTSCVNTSFSLDLKNYEGQETGTLMALYPHQWKNMSEMSKSNLLPGLEYNSVRGTMKLLAGKSFQTSHRFTGILPSLPNVKGCDTARIQALLAEEIKQPVPGPKDTYWDGKWMGRAATLIPIAEQYGETKIADELRSRVKTRLESWFTAKADKKSNTFAYEPKWGTLIGYPASFGSDNELNDHHFHYGYFIRAAAEIARTDPAWANSEQWGGMVEVLIRDTASPNRDDKLFPFLRNFDPYAGHSWASGHAKFGDGNNNESSSEAMNAWYGIIQWGEYTGNRRMRDLGIYLYTTEMNAINEYWFDITDSNHPPEYTPSVVTMVWGGKGANGTWFTANPEMVHGINWLPIHGGSLYLGQSREYVDKNYSALKKENGDKPWDAWADLIFMYRALTQPDDALQQLNAVAGKLPTEEGNSPTNTYHWIGSLQQLGQVQASVTANTVQYAVFDKEKTRTYVVYQHESKPRTVRFSDGFEMKIDKPGFHVTSGPTK